MLSAVTTEYGKSMVLKNDEIPTPPPRGVIVKTEYCGVCHSDIHHWRDDFKFGTKRLPLVLGHEISGTVYSLGTEAADEDGDDLKIGDKVLIYPWIGCSECELCKGSSPHLCSTPTYRMGIQAAGGYSSYVSVVSKRYAIKVPKSTAMDMACMLPCSALTTYNAVEQARPHAERFLKLRGKATVMVIGAGGLGLWCVQLTRTLMPDVRILSCDVTTGKVNTALNFGADDTVVWEIGCNMEDAKNKVLQKNGGQTVDVIIDVVGAGSTVERALSVVTKAGAIVIVGLFGGELKCQISSLIFRSLTLAAVNVGSISQLKRLVKLLNEGKIRPPPFECYDLSQANIIFDLLEDRKINGRALFKF